MMPKEVATTVPRADPDGLHTVVMVGRDRDETDGRRSVRVSVREYSGAPRGRSVVWFEASGEHLLDAPPAGLLVANLDRDGVNRLIHVLRTVRAKAFGDDE